MDVCQDARDARGSGGRVAGAKIRIFAGWWEREREEGLDEKGGFGGEGTWLGGVQWGCIDGRWDGW